VENSPPETHPIVPTITPSTLTGKTYYPISYERGGEDKV